MSDFLKRVVRYPLYYICSYIPFLGSFIFDYQFVYGPDFSVEKKIYKLARKNNFFDDKNGTDYWAVSDGKMFQYFNKKENNRVIGYDYDSKNIEYSEKFFLKSKVMKISNYLSIPKRVDSLICYNILNCLDSEKRKEIYSFCKQNYKRILFVGDEYVQDRPALGPEPIGSYGCKQFLTSRLFEEVSAEFVTKKYFIDDKKYCYIASKD